MTRAEALALYDSLAPVDVGELRGRWRGAGMPTGHPMDGLLEKLGWWGKEFVDDDRVHPLLFEGAGGKLIAVDPRRLPIAKAMIGPAQALGWLFPMVRPLFRTTKPRAKLRMVEHRGKPSAAMIYDDVPIVDHFRKLADGEVLGLMEMPGVEPFFFVLRRAA